MKVFTRLRNVELTVSATFREETFQTGLGSKLIRYLKFRYNRTAGTGKVLRVRQLAHSAHISQYRLRHYGTVIILYITKIKTVYTH